MHVGSTAMRVEGRETKGELSSITVIKNRSKKNIVLMLFIHQPMSAQINNSLQTSIITIRNTLIRVSHHRTLDTYLAI